MPDQRAHTYHRESAGYASSGTLNLRSVLAQVATRKGATFHFGSTYEANSQNEAWMENAYS
jgi:endo-1,4-beta-xylanase